VYKFDHYCVWIGNCIGGLNHRYFLALLISISAMCIHGVWGIVKVFTAIITVYQIRTTGTVHLIKVIQTQPYNTAQITVYQITTGTVHLIKVMQMQPYNTDQLLHKATVFQSGLIVKPLLRKE